MCLAWPLPLNFSLGRYSQFNQSLVDGNRLPFDLAAGVDVPSGKERSNRVDDLVRDEIPSVQLTPFIMGVEMAFFTRRTLRRRRISAFASSEVYVFPPGSKHDSTIFSSSGSVTS